MRVMKTQLKMERLLEHDPMGAVRAILEKPFWIPSLKTDQIYSRLHDDHDGTKLGHVGVSFSCDGDAWVHSDFSHHTLRFRTYGGGGMSLRTRCALMLLAEAIRLDNEERQQ